MPPAVFGPTTQSSFAAACTRCPLCHMPSTLAAALEKMRLPSNVLALQGQEFTVWRCRHCDSLHVAEAADLNQLYDNYPLARQRWSPALWCLMRQRLKLLRRLGLQPGQRVLDFGCGAGRFVNFLNRAGFDAQGYDAFVPQHAKPERLTRTYDAVVCQDVLEHAPDPVALLSQLGNLLAPGGRLYLGTPDARAIQLHELARHRLELHVPFHRHILSAQVLDELAYQTGLEVLVRESLCYLDTPWPLLNMRFLRALNEGQGGWLDDLVTPPPGVWKQLLLSPRLLVDALLGSLKPDQGHLLWALQRRPTTAYI